MSKQAERTVRRGKHEETAAEDGDEVHVDGEPPVDAPSSKCLGSCQKQDATTDQATRVRLAQDRARFNQMHHIWIDENLTVGSKVRTCKTSIATTTTTSSTSTTPTSSTDPAPDPAAGNRTDDHGPPPPPPPG